ILTGQVGRVGQVGLPDLPDLQSGIFPCFFGGFLSRLFSRLRSAVISLRRVSRGWMTSSMNPRPAAIYGFANFARNSATLSARTAAGSAAESSSRLYRMLTAPSGPITAISAVGHA